MSAAVSAAMAASAAATAGTAYYMLSDGGDAAVARRRADAALARVLRSPTSAAPGPGAPAAAGDGSPQDTTATAAGVLRTGTDADVVADASPRRRRGHTPAPPLLERAEGTTSHGRCHTCSGPRLWFYADKLGVTRLKRRIGPYPDSTQ